MAWPAIGRAAMPYLSRAGGHVFTAGRVYVGRTIKTYTTKPKTWLDWTLVGIEASQLGYAGYQFGTRYHPNKTDNMVAPYMMEERYP